MAEFTVNDTLELTKAIIRNEVPKEYTSKDAQSALRQSLIELNGGSDQFSARNFRPGTEMFDFVEKYLDVVVNEGLKGDEFFMNYVEYINVNEGDKNIFYTEDKDTFVVSEIGRGNQGIRRQRLGWGEQFSVPTSPKAIRVYEHLSRIMSNRVDFSVLTQRVAASIQKHQYMDIFKLFTSLSATTQGMYAQATYTGTYDEDSILDVIQHVEADNEAPATIIGTLKALRQLEMDVVADQAKTDMYMMGYYGRFNGIPTFRIESRYAEGTRDFIFPDDKLYIVAGQDKFIKFVTEGQPLLNTVSALDNMDLTQEYFYIWQYGVAMWLMHCIGLVTLTKG